VLRGGSLPAPAHLAGSMLRMRCLSLRDKIAIARALSAMRRERLTRTDLDRIAMIEWLQEKRQPPRAIERFWRQVLVSAINEDLERMAARHGFQAFWLGFLSRRDSYEMGVPAAPLGQLYSSEAWRGMSHVQLRLRQPVERVEIADGRVSAVIVRGERRLCSHCVLAVPFERVPDLCPELGLRFNGWEHSPITGIHLWFDRIVTGLPHATLLDRTIQWFFNKGEGRYLQLVVSASRSLLEMPASEVVALVVRELAEFLPAVKSATLLRNVVIKEARATFSARPGLDHERPLTETAIEGLYLAGDWVRTGWPATMEGAARAGYMAAEAVTRDQGSPQRYLLPDLA
jgi:zeta-carotene desaturase